MNDLEEDFAAKLSRAAADIKNAAAGRVCGDCAHARDGWCSQQQNIDGSNLAIYSLHAVACGKFQENR